jgi:hypothetical protein
MAKGKAGTEFDRMDSVSVLAKGRSPRKAHYGRSTSTRRTLTLISRSLTPAIFEQTQAILAAERACPGLPALPYAALAPLWEETRVGGINLMIFCERQGGPRNQPQIFKRQ